MRSLFIDRTIVKGYHENVYTEDGKVGVAFSPPFIALGVHVADAGKCEKIKSPEPSCGLPKKRRWYYAKRLTFNLNNFSAIFPPALVHLLAFQALLPLLEFLIPHLRPLFASLLASTGGNVISEPSRAPGSQGSVFPPLSPLPLPNHRVMLCRLYGQLAKTPW